jgi:hypothetical protein
VLSNEVSITMAGKAFAEDGRLLDEKRNTAVRTLGLVLTQFLRKIHS